MLIEKRKWEINRFFSALDWIFVIKGHSKNKLHFFGTSQIPLPLRFDIVPYFIFQN